jgi:hypothetical protein
MNKTAVAVAALFAAAASNIHADTPIQLSLTPDIALYPKDEMVNGLSLGIWSQNPQKSLTIGLVNGSTGESAGLSYGLFNYAESYQGVQLGWVNYSSQSFTGWQHGYVNIAKGTFVGLQSAAVNVADEVNGVQIGVLNYAESLHGVQLGVVNIARNNPWFDGFPDKLATGFPILNWSF